MIVYIPATREDRDNILESKAGWDGVIFTDSYSDPGPKWKHRKRRQIPIITVYIREKQFLRFWWDFLSTFNRPITEGNYLGRDYLTIEGINHLKFMRRVNEIPRIYIERKEEFYLPE